MSKEPRQASQETEDQNKNSVVKVLQQSLFTAVY